MKSMKTPKGTELPLRDLQGKAYLDTQYRVLWMREDHPDWSIRTEFLVLTSDEAIAKAEVRNQTGAIVAQGTKRETPATFKRGYIEKAETGAIGRALGFAGYGTQFALDLDEPNEDGSDNPVITDAPVAHLKAVTDSAGYVMPFGQYVGKSLEEIGPHDLSNYAKWIREEAVKKGRTIQGTTLEAVNAIDAFVKSREYQRAK